MGSMFRCLHGSRAVVNIDIQKTHTTFGNMQDMFREQFSDKDLGQNVQTPNALGDTEAQPTTKEQIANVWVNQRL